MVLPCPNAWLDSLTKSLARLHVSARHSRLCNVYSGAVELGDGEMCSMQNEAL